MRGDMFEVLRQSLKARRMTYADLAARMAVSEPTVKRMFVHRDCKLSRLTEICDILEIDLPDLLDRANRLSDEVITLPLETERRLARAPSLFYLFILLRERLPQADLQSRFELSDQDLYRMGRQLEELGLAEVGPGGRIRMVYDLPIRFRTDGPLIALIRTINTRFLSKMIQGQGEERAQFLTISRKMLPDSAALIADEITELHKRIGEVARQDQLIAAETDLSTFKFTVGWGEVDFREILTIEPEEATGPATDR